VYRHLLVPIDETDLSTATIGRAAEFAKEVGARITFFHAQPDHQSSLFGEADIVRLNAPEQFTYCFEGRPLELLMKAESAARALGVSCGSLTAVSNSPHRAIVAAAVKAGCDLIYMASHGRRSHIGMLLGSQTLKVLMSSPIPVLVSATSNPSLAARTIGIIRDEHRSLAAVLHAGLQLLGSARAEGVRPSPEVLREMVDYLERFPIALHHPKEDNYLFRLLRERTSEVDVELDDLCRSHVRDRRLVHALADTVDRYCEGRAAPSEVEQAIQGYGDFIYEHMAGEERVILPAALRHLTANDWEEIHAAFAENGDPRLGGDAEAEFRRLFSRIVNLAGPAKASNG
jgi:hemerythrin-like domain-containing protein/nucleotide-binding universal stress UspA family protein